jgi:hypothetical protein
MIKVNNKNTGAINYFVDMTYTHAFIRKNDLSSLYDANIVITKELSKPEILKEIFNDVFFIIEKTNSKFDINFKRDIFKISFNDIGIDFIVELRKPRINTNVQDENSSVVIGKYYLFKKHEILSYHKGNYIFGNKNHNSEILKLIIYGTNNKPKRFWNSIWNNLNTRSCLYKGGNDKKTSGNPGI